MRRITEIIVHCSATPEGCDYGARDIDLWHRQRGFLKIGYHYVVKLDGTIQEGRKLNDVGAHCSGHNANSIGVCYVGGLRSLKGLKGSKGSNSSNSSNSSNDLVPADTRTDAQKFALLKLLQSLKVLYPKARIYGHRDFANKACPCFDATAEYSEL